MDPIFSIALDQEALLIFTIIHEFFGGAEARKRNPALETFPQSLEFIPWRKVYTPPAEAQIGAIYPIMEPWQPSELSFGGAGSLWCFTVLPRIGENVSRKTEEGLAWSSKTGRGPKKGYPDLIWVDKLVISGKAFHMLELTLNQEKPTVALCKIWRGNNLGASTSSSFQEVQNSPVSEGLTSMQIDLQPQGQLQGIEQQQMDDFALSMSDYVLVNSTQGLPNFTEVGIQSTWPDDDTVYQGAVTYLYNEMESFKQVAPCSKDEAHEIASAAQSLASSLRNMLNKFLGMKIEAENPRPTNASNDNQIMGTSNNEANPAEPAPEAMTQAEFPDQDLVQLAEQHSIDNDTADQDQVQWCSFDSDIDYDYFNSDDLIDQLQDRGNGANFDADDLSM